ncbi:DUF3955 domain-containing protein [Photobacterium carnosum]|uniref:DUF3955 domain-containing protein n=1 Tax=Photobacterium carnosum TaxID=2023717 RepID=UPI001E623CDB|nr:DUF3955 domain-containing protein [Photobacterium carnosum]MCD9500033.1 DUF3955 domain-containing protein [Photobacterium carnosum]MCD9516627.1 DUF3955 domain-containing protein [Photobacterium carnosum]MCD9557749.1 DUF3955 domain-containing protein [Photobacterium carnosum]
MKILKKYWLSVLFLTFSLICLICFNLTGSYINQDGFLIEAFGFIPLFWLFIFCALLSFLVSFFISMKNRIHR